MQTIISILSLAVLSSCVAPTPDEIMRADIGPPPTAYQQTIASCMQAVLRDPGSLVLRTGEPERWWYRANIYVSPRFAWRVIARFNARNGFGGYVGDEERWFFFLGEYICAIGYVDRRGIRRSTMTFIEVGSGGLTYEAAGLATVGEAGAK